MKIFALLVVVILVAIVSIGIGEGEEVIPPNPGRFIGSWHPAPECGPCHTSLLSEDAVNEKLGNCKCHREAYTSNERIDGDKIRKTAHGVKVCIDCHIGSGIGVSKGELPGEDLHRLHRQVDCQACHDEGASLLIPSSGNCDLCHSGDSHSIHGDMTGNLCVACHGSFGIEYKEKGYILIEGVPKKPEEVTYPTITNMLKAIIKFIFEPKEGGAQ
ncbi:MAG TPA: hypothetical protein EYP28_06510 [Methanophagales archaeon]|nr:hypothetical protein [Methanophagales archaeon]